MILIPVLIALSLEYYFHWGAELRQFGWFNLYIKKVESQFEKHSFYVSWIGVLLIVLGPVFLLYFIVNLFDGTNYFILLFLVSVGALFYSLGPKPLAETMAGYFSAMERGDQEAAFLRLKEEIDNDDLPESQEFVRNVTRFVLVESNKRYFGVIFWFIILGPFGALFYRLAYLYHKECQKQVNEHLIQTTQLIHWIDWLPARLTSFLNLLTGDFLAGFYRLKDYLTDFQSSNNQVLSETGISALGLTMGLAEDGVKENRDAMDMVQRTGIFYLVAAIFLSPLALW
ncbi:regulatory signaling modulator protein AmpE [Aliikangiella sp. G2MR2-5]|uniref:regulatory signaling modulator protein AmpE n=1 Tax=Aliikangiella sp. G2MR2-5 TaxID=2788943 RepID=UPI0018AA00A7|nr:regulatory signaling modulator protein AmpE [Aliikangiella sp. G2MR2-5]